jgi:hypothetical protein
VSKTGDTAPETDDFEPNLDLVTKSRDQDDSYFRGDMKDCVCDSLLKERFHVTREMCGPGVQLFADLR